MIQQIRPARSSGNALVTIAIGESLLNEWEEHASHSWLDYCERHGLGLFVVTGDLIDSGHPCWKKPTWQKMLIGKAIDHMGVDLDNICYLDSDILVSPVARNIFDFYTGSSIGLVSLVNGLPYDRIALLKKVTALRQVFIDSAYPDDSAIHLNGQEIYSAAGLPVQRDFACMGLILFNVAKHSNHMAEIFYKYPKETQSLTGGDQTHYNFELFSEFDVELLDYRFQTIWQYELAEKYPFLYDPKIFTSGLLARCIENTLREVDFLHFAGSWNDGRHWKKCRAFNDLVWNEFHGKYQALISSEINSRLYGRLKLP